MKILLLSQPHPVVVNLKHKVRAANFLGLKSRVNFATLSPCSSSLSFQSGFSFALQKNAAGRVRRRVALGLGTSVLALLMSIATSMNFSSGNSLFASATENSSFSVQEMLKNVEWPEQFPFKEEDFQRFDESPDSQFYEMPRFVTHIDDAAIAALTKYYSKVFPPSNTPGVSLLDMCSSWVSHFPAGFKQDRIVGLGLNEEELKRNPVLTEYIVQDLNLNPVLPFEDNSFDVITNVVSVDYLSKPLDVFKEMCRILKPSGMVIISFSNRCFWTKAISIWTSTGDAEHALIVGSYFHYVGGFEPPQALDISPHPGRSDPMYIVYSKKLRGPQMA